MDKLIYSVIYILDFLITRVCDFDLFDYFVVYCDILIIKFSFERKEIEVCKLKIIDITMICDELFNFLFLLYLLEDFY